MKNEIIFEDNLVNICKIINIDNNIQYKLNYFDYYIDLLNIYKIKFNVEDKELNNNEKVITINTDNNEYEIVSLENFIKYNQYDIFDIDENVMLKILYDIGFIIKLLERENKAIFSISIKDIIVINNDTFLFVNINKILNINKKYIYYQNTLSNEELLKFPFSISNNKTINELPIKVSYNNVYYTFGILLLDLLYYNKKKNYVTNLNCISVLKSFKKYKYSGLYFFIKRCLKENSEDRTLLFL